MTRILTLTEERKNTVINETIQVLKNGGLVVFPSDTVYGLLVDAQNEKAVEKLITFKNRPPGKAISVFVADMDMIHVQAVVNSRQKALLQTLLPGPFTIVLDSKHTISRKLESEKGTIGLRIPNYEPVQTLISNYCKPVTATSANLGGRHPHYSIESLLKQLPKQKAELIDLIVDAGKLPRNKPSTVLDLTTEEVQILRQGDIVFDTEERYISKSPSQTRKIGQYLVEKALQRKKDKPLVFIMKGDLGAGKTEMTRGIAGYLGVEKIVSPTFVVYYEYDIPKENYELFVHVDLYNIQEKQEFEYLGLADYLDKPSVMVIEWGEKLGDLYDEFRKKATIIFIELKHNSAAERIIEVKE